MDNWQISEQFSEREPDILQASSRNPLMPGSIPSSHPLITFQSPDLEKSADDAQISTGCLEGVWKVSQRSLIDAGFTTSHWEEITPKLFSPDVFTEPSPTSGVPLMIISHPLAPDQASTK